MQLILHSHQALFTDSSCNTVIEKWLLTFRQIKCPLEGRGISLNFHLQTSPDDDATKYGDFHIMNCVAMGTRIYLCTYIHIWVFKQECI